MAGALAAVFDGPGRPLRVARIAAPVLESGQVLVAIDCCTVCGSDLHTYTGRRPAEVPQVLGHEMCGRIVEIRGEARDLAGMPLRPGDRVTWAIVTSCGDCFYCRAGVPQKCASGFKYGHGRLGPDATLHGGLGEVCTLLAGTAIVRIPDALSDREAAPANCATASVAGAFRAAGNCEGANVMVVGAGMLGLTACAMAASGGAATVMVCEPDPQRRAMASRFGATHGFGANALDSVRAATGGLGADIVLELAGNSEAVALSLAAARIGGHCIWLGSVFPGGSVPIEPEQIVKRMLRITGIHNYAPDDLAAAIAFLAAQRTRFPFEDLVPEEFPLSEAEAAFQYALTARPPRVAVRVR